MNSPEGIPATVVGRYALFEEIAAGGMATVHYGRLLGPVGFSRTVAIKRLHPHLARDPEFAAMFLDEARVAARVRHPNVVPTLDIVSTQGELFLVMEYVQGEALSRLLRAARRRGTRMPPPVAAAIIVGTLHGLHAAHESKNERGQPLGIVHRDVSPQNVLVGLDGIPRLVDFGVAKAAGRLQTTREGQLKGKIAYMAPEQIRGATSTRLVDVYAAAVLLWEMLTGDRLFGGDNDVTVLERVLHMEVRAPSAIATDVSKELDAIVLKALAREPEKRFGTAREMAREIENAIHVASVSKVGEWVESIAGEVIAERAAKVADIESQSQIRPYVPTPPPSVAPAPAPAPAPPPPASSPPAGAAATPAPTTDATEVTQADDLPSEPRAGKSEPPAGVPRSGIDRRVLVGAGVGGAALLLIVGVGVALSSSGKVKDSASTTAALSVAATETPPPAAVPPPTTRPEPVATMTEAHAVAPPPPSASAAS
ncbi:MAG TPA: serine/threonine-protein kinase [Polyangiaceae bacterium]|nr:serine/threonine-protein kinase [Polyangiaceae bacterium]